MILTVQGIEYIDSEFRECLTKCTGHESNSMHEKRSHLDFFSELVKKCLLFKGFSHSEREKNNKDTTRSLIVLFVICNHRKNSIAAFKCALSCRKFVYDAYLASGGR